MESIINQFQDFVYQEYEEDLFEICYSNPKRLLKTVDDIIISVKSCGLDVQKLYTLYATDSCKFIYDEYDDHFENANYRFVLRNRLILYYFILLGYSNPKMWSAYNMRCPCEDPNCKINSQDRFNLYLCKTTGLSLIIRIQRRFRKRLRMREAATRIARWWLAISYNPHHPVGHRIQLARYANLLVKNSASRI